MARTVIIRVTDDFDKSTVATEVREVGYNGVIHVLDLTVDHAKELDELLEPYLDAAHEKVKWPKRQLQQALKTTAPPAPIPSVEGAQTLVDKEQRRRVRAWLRRNGHQVSDRGYIPAVLQQTYDEAHKGRKNS